MNRNCGVYEIKNIKNNKRYIGSSKRIEGRWKDHKSDLKNKKHHSIHLQRAWDKYGDRNFEFNVLIYCSESDLSFYEKQLMDNYDALNYKKGYNENPYVGRPLARSGKDHHSWVSKKEISCEKCGKLYQIKPYQQDGTKFCSRTCFQKWMSEDKSGKNSHAWKGGKLTKVCEECGEKYEVGRWEANSSRFCSLECLGESNIEYGEDNPNNTLTVKEVKEIKKLLKDGETQTSIAKQYDANQPAISQISRGETWTHVSVDS